MTEPVDDDRPALAVYVVWHPDAAVSGALASAVFRELCADPDVPARRGLGIPVRFRSSYHATTAPEPIPFGAAKRTAVFVLADDKLVAEPVWRNYVAALAEARRAGDIVVAAEHAAGWYGLSADTLQRGLDELRELELLKVWSRAKKAPRTRFGYTVENHYALQGPFVRAPIESAHATKAAA